MEWNSSIFRMFWNIRLQSLERSGHGWKSIHDIYQTGSKLLLGIPYSIHIKKTDWSVDQTAFPVPDSSCITDETGCGWRYGDNEEKIYPEGCVDKVSECSKCVD